MISRPSKFLVLSSLICVAIFTHTSQAGAASSWAPTGRVHSSLLFLMDNFGSTTVYDVYDNEACEGDPIFVVFGKEIDNVDTTGRCVRARVLQGSETVLERYDASGEVIDTQSTGSSLFWTGGVNAESKHKNMKLRADGRLSHSLLKERTLYGVNRSQYQFSNLYFEYENLEAKHAYTARAGRQHVGLGVLVDGVSASYHFGPKSRPSSKSIGTYFGLAPNAVTKKISTEALSFGALFRWIPEFSQGSESKFLFESNFHGETYKGKVQRLLLHSRSHFTPYRQLSFLHYSTLELPWSGDNSKVQSGYFSLQTFYRPNDRLNLSLGLTQFRIDRFLVETAIRNVLQDSLQADRVGESIDRSDRYRVDFRTGFKLSPQLEIYQRSRYERRNFDSDKRNLNNPNLPEDQENRPEGDDNTSLTKANTAYQLSLGAQGDFRENIEWQTELSYRKRYLSKAYDVWQSLTWMPKRKYYLNFDLQVLKSERDVQSSFPTGSPREFQTWDVYFGIGGNYEFKENLWGRLRYDLAHEKDYALQRSTLTHSLFARVDYRF